jgi:hypothetical protein
MVFKPGIESYGEIPAKICILGLGTTRPNMYHYCYGSLQELADYQQRQLSCVFNTRKEAEKEIKANQKSCLMT